MAAVQATDPMQQRGQQSGANPPMGAGANILPSGMNKEMVQNIYKRYQQMKAQGTPENDPELLKTRAFLQSIQQRTELVKRQQQQQRLRQQQQAQQQQQQGAGIAQQNGGPPQLQTQSNGMSAPNGAAAGSQPSGANGTPSAPLQTPMSASSATGPAAFDSTNEHAFSKDQVLTLQAQMRAFAFLQKNMPIPANIKDRALAVKQEQQPESLSDGITAAGKVLEESAKTGSKNAQDDGKPRHQFETFTDPHSLVLKHISYADHGNRENRAMLPSIMPLGVDPERVREERENMVYNRVMARRQELAKTSANIGAWDSSKSDVPSDNSNLKLRALIEYKMLCLLPKQREMRTKIGKEMASADNLSMTANRTLYRRVKKQSLREARITEKLEKQQRDAAETKEKKKHIEFIRSITEHANEIRSSAQAHKARVQKLGRMMVNTHSNIEKEEQKRIERTAKQRLQALKANDEETYLKLLDQAKDSRISHLLKQTDGFLNQLASSVKEQQRSIANRQGQYVPEDEPEEEEEEVDSDDESKPKVDYYEVAHKIKEEIKAQSSNLVGGSLKEYQLKGLQWMISLYNNNLNGILADEMGLGKTIQSISLVTYLIEKKRQPGPFLVIVPLSTLTNWNTEFEKWAPSVQRIVYKGPPNQRKTLQQQIRYGNFQVLLTTYEFIIKDRPVLSKVKWLHMIVDEGHRMKNAGSKLSSTITQYYHTRYRLILTGTPLQNNLPELWALLNFVLPNIFKSAKSFDEWFNTPFANTGGQDKMDLNEEEQLLVIKRLHKVLRPFLLRRLKKDVEKDLPDKQERVIKCNFSALQAKLYKQLVTHNRIMVNDDKGRKTGMRGLSNMLMQLRKLCNHPFVFEEVETQMNPERITDDLIWRTAGKFELLDRVLPKFHATGHKCLIFFQMTQIMNIMEDFLRYRGLQYLRLDGSTKADDRSDLLHTFNAPDSPYFCFLLSTRAGGLGLNLQTADTVIIFDSDWNPHQDLQAQDRAHRIGQKNEVRILRLISSNSVEEKILERAQYKLGIDGKVIQAGKFDNKSTNEERDEMLRVMLDSAEAAESLEQDEMDDDDLNMIMMRNDSELEVFQRLDAERAKSLKYGPNRKLGRLLGESELPDIYMNEDNPVVEEIETIYGRGTRERTKVKYDDGLTEEQWLAAVDDDEDTIEEAVARKQQRIARRVAKKESRLRDENDLGTSPPPSRESSESPPPVPKPKARSRKSAGGAAAGGSAKADKRKADDASLDDGGAAEQQQPPKKRGRGNNKQDSNKSAGDNLSREERETLQNILDSVHDSLQDLEEESNDPNLPNRGIIDPFLELPPRNDYPDYYQLIRQPICMKNIERKINRKEYSNLRQFRQDIGLLCSNCRQYNEDGSILYNDANLIERACLDKLRDETANHPDFQDFDGPANDGNSNDGTSTRPMSSVSTPQPSGAGAAAALPQSTGAGAGAHQSSQQQQQKSGFKLKLGGPRANGSAGGGTTGGSRGASESLAQSDDD